MACHQLGVLFECRVCADFFVAVTREFASSADLPEVQRAAQKARCGRKKGWKTRKRRVAERRAVEEALAHVLVAEQDRWHRATWTGRRACSRLATPARCPSCTETVHEMDYQSWFERPALTPAFSLCAPVVFDDDREDGGGGNGGGNGGGGGGKGERSPGGGVDHSGGDRSGDRGGSGGGDDDDDFDFVPLGSGPLPPVYLNTKAHGKPKWTLCQGIGPASLEMDRSRSNRVWRPPLAKFGLCENKQTASRFSFADASPRRTDADGGGEHRPREKSEAAAEYSRVVDASRRAAEDFQVVGPSPMPTERLSAAKMLGGSNGGVSGGAPSMLTGAGEGGNDAVLGRLFGFGAVPLLPSKGGTATGRIPSQSQAPRTITRNGARVLVVLKRHAPLGKPGAWDRALAELKLLD